MKAYVIYCANFWGHAIQYYEVMNVRVVLSDGEDVYRIVLCKYKFFTNLKFLQVYGVLQFAKP